MLSNALFYVALMAVVATTFITAGMAMTRASIHRLSESYIEAGEQRAFSALTQTLAADIREGALPAALPVFTPIPASCVQSGQPCGYYSSETITLTPNASPQPFASCDPASSNCASNEEANTYVDENRVSARISVTVTAADGTAVATRSRDVILRTLRTPPYIAVSGSNDESSDNLAPAHAAGDDGGLPPATPNPCAAQTAGTGGRYRHARRVSKSGNGRVRGREPMARRVIQRGRLPGFKLVTLKNKNARWPGSFRRALPPAGCDPRA